MPDSFFARQSEFAAPRQQEQGQQERRIGGVLDRCRRFPFPQDQSQRSLDHRMKDYAESLGEAIRRPFTKALTAKGGRSDPQRR
jgi:hypothetical protein